MCVLPGFLESHFSEGSSAAPTPTATASNVGAAGHTATNNAYTHAHSYSTCNSIFNRGSNDSGYQRGSVEGGNEFSQVRPTYT
jgi:hypothetical protein